MKKLLYITSILLCILLSGCRDATSVGIIGGADGPTSIIVAEKRKRSDYLKLVKNMPDVLKINDVCVALGGISTKTGYKMLRDGKIKSIKVGREYIVTKLDLIDYLMKTQ